MCNNCYHSIGRNKKAWKCPHIKKSHYAKGICQNCYQSNYILKTKKVEVNKNSSSNVSEKSEIENCKVE